MRFSAVEEEEEEDDENKKLLMQILRTAFLGFIWRVRLDVWIERVPSERVGSADRGGREMQATNNESRRFYAFRISVFGKDQ